MVNQMKTTIEIADPLLEAARRAAAEDGLTLRALVESGLRAILAERVHRRSTPFELRDASVDGDGLHPELADAGWDTIRAMAYGGRIDGDRD